ncbi:MAG: hypothetical protein KC561_21150, partial [Myxococcales bacterium]|nr:hypothetical protein [Myxococcales bacterium]
MRYCESQGRLVDAWGFVPDNPWEYGFGSDVPNIGCSSLRCRRCGQPVKHREGLSLKHGVAIAAEVLYHAPEWRHLDGIRDAPLQRLYVCRCFVFPANGTIDLSRTPDDPSLPTFPWICDGHPIPGGSEVWEGIELGALGRIEFLRLIRDTSCVAERRQFRGIPGIAAIRLLPILGPLERERL